MPLFSPHERISQVPVDQVFDVVRYLMFRWGFIGAFRADNGAPFGDPSRRALSALNLCLRAYGIHVKLNPPRRPQKNAKVERNQGTTCRWADPKSCKDYIDFQIQLNQAVFDQREVFKTRVCKGKTRAEYFPDLFLNPNKFNTDGFFPHLTYEHLATGRWNRKVSKDGSTRLFGVDYQVGRPHRLKEVTVTFDPDQFQWVFMDRNGHFLKAIHAANLHPNHIRNLSIRQ
jgi:transposase InsO family protein